METDLEGFGHATEHQLRQRLNRAIDDEMGEKGSALTAALLTHGGEHGLLITSDGNFEPAPASEKVASVWVVENRHGICVAVCADEATALAVCERNRDSRCDEWRVTTADEYGPAGAAGHVEGVFVDDDHPDRPGVSIELRKVT